MSALLFPNVIHLRLQAVCQSASPSCGEWKLECTGRGEGRRCHRAPDRVTVQPAGAAGPDWLQRQGQCLQNGLCAHRPFSALPCPSPLATPFLFNTNRPFDTLAPMVTHEDKVGQEAIQAVLVLEIPGVKAVQVRRARGRTRESPSSHRPHFATAIAGRRRCRAGKRRHEGSSCHSRSERSVCGAPIERKGTSTRGGEVCRNARECGLAMHG